MRILGDNATRSKSGLRFESTKLAGDFPELALATFGAHYQRCLARAIRNISSHAAKRYQGFE